MAGENSKKSGEVGEALTKGFLSAIGWSDSLRTVAVKCSNNDHKGKTGNQKTSHGDDSVFIYNSPFFDNQTEIVHVSSKNTKDEYSLSEQRLRTTLKDHLEEHNEIIACAKFDGELLGLLDNFKAKKKKVHSGLLVWTSSTAGSQETSILEKMKGLQLSSKCLEKIFFVDNARANFIVKSVEDVAARSEGSYKFYYPSSGALSNNSIERCGDILPLELIVADVIPFKVTIGGVDKLYIYVNEEFSVATYKKLIWLGMSFAGAWPKDIHIGFSDYNQSEHDNDAQAALLAFSERDKNIFPFCFNKSLLSTLEEK